MYTLRSTEAHLSLLRQPCGFKLPRVLLGKAAKSANPGCSSRKYSTGNHVSARYVSRPPRAGSTIKLREVTKTRLLTTDVKPQVNLQDFSLFNPNKTNPQEVTDLIIPPISPLTLPRFPRSDGVATLPSVTKILQATMPAASRFLLDRWQEAMLKKLGAAGFAQYQKETFERGRLLHSVIADYLLGNGEPRELTHEVVSNLWKSIEKVVMEQISNVRLVEHIVTHSDLKYRGIIDAVAVYKDELVVIDFKTAEKPKKNIESLFDNPLQVTAYCGALNNDQSIPKHVIDRNICSGLVIVAYIDGSEASVYYLGREKLVNDYWRQWKERLDQFSRMEQANSATRSTDQVRKS